MSVRSRVWIPSLIILSLAVIAFGLTVHPAAQAAQSLQLQVLESDSNHIVLELDIPSYDTREQTVGGTTYTILAVPGMVHTAEAGKPLLPIKGVMVGIPPGAQPSLNVLDDESAQTTLARPPIPVATANINTDPTLTLPTFTGNSIIPNPAAYSADGKYPIDVAKISGVGNWRTQHYANVEFHAFQYIAATRALTFHRRLQVEVKLTYPRGLSPSSLGQSTNEGPFETVFQKALANYSSAKNWRTSRVTSAGLKPLSPSSYSGGPWFRIGVTADGIYQITCGQLASAAGQSSLSIDASTLQVEKLSAPMAINVVGSGWGSCASNDTADYIEFFGQAPDAKYTNTNIYWLTYGSGAGKRMAVHAGGGIGTVATSFTDTIHVEENHLYRSQVPLVEGINHWYWNFVFPAAGAPTQDYTFQISNLASGTFNATLQVDLTGFSSGNHSTQISLNGSLIDDAATDGSNWSGGTVRNATFTFSQSLLNVGANTIHLVNPDSNDFIFTNYFNVSYQRPFTTAQDVLRFNQLETAPTQYQVDGFSDGTVETFDITDPSNVARVDNSTVTPGPCPCSLGFADSTPGQHEYLALTPAKRLPPASIILDTSSNLHSTANGADYIVIANKAFLQAVQPLASYRASQGMRVKVVDVQNVYDEFSDGLVDAQAIHDFLQYAYSNWQAPAPSFVLLVGSGNFDPKGYCATPGWCSFTTPPNSTLLPPYLRMVDPFQGESNSDNRLVAFDLNDTLPDIAIGRLPAYTAGDVTTMVNKILTYEQNPPAGNWKTKLTFVGDQPDPNAGDFWALSDLVASNPNYVPAPFSLDKIYYPQSPYSTPSAAHDAIVSDINSGRLIVNFVGHGAISSWSNSGFFSAGDIPNFTNGDMMPVMLEMTCRTGYFVFPTIPSLAEVEVRQAGGGAVASWAASGLGVATGHDFLDEGFFGAVMQQGVYQLGPATILGKLNLWQNTGGAFYDLIDTFDLMGDPATRLAVPQADVTISKSVQPTGPLSMGSPITYTLAFTNNSSGLAEKVRIADTLAPILLNPKAISSGVPITLIGGAPFSWNVGNLAPGAGGSITITAFLDPNQTHYSNLTLTNTATISTATAQSNTTNDQSTVITSIIKKYFIYLPFIRR